MKIEVRDGAEHPQPSARMTVLNPESGRTWPLPQTSAEGTLEVRLVPGRYRFLRGEQVLAEVVSGATDPEPLSIRWDG